MSYYLQGLGAITQAFPSNGMNSAAFASILSQVTTYRDPQLGYRPITCYRGMVLDASGSGCVQPSKCSEGSLLNLKTGECVFPNKAAPINFTAIKSLSYAKPIMTDLGPVDKVAACAAQGGVLNPQTGECVTAIPGTGGGDLPSLCAGAGGVWSNGACDMNSIRPPAPDHTMLYVGLAAAAVAAIAIGVVMMKKKGES